MKHKLTTRLISLLLVIVTLVGLLIPASAASLGESGTVKITQDGFGNYLTKKSGGTIGGGYWKYTSNNGLTGSAYCVNWGLTGVSPSKSLTVQEYNRNPQTMGAFTNGYPNRTLAQFKELHTSDVRGIAQLTETEYKYATQVAVWATCGQISVPGTSFTAGRTAVVEPTSDAQKIRIFDSIKAILALSAHWTKYLHPGLSLRAEEDKDIRAVEIVHDRGLEGAAAANQDGLKKETINGKEYYTRVVYVSSATTTWIDGYTTKVYSTDAPQGTIFVAENGSPLETVQENGGTCYKVSTQKNRSTNLNANGEEYYGAFKVCVPADNVADEGSFTIKATGGVAQFNLYLAYNPSSSEQSYIISDPAYTTLDASMPFKWSKTGTDDGSASLQIVKTGPGGGPLEGAEFTLTGDKGTTLTGTSDRNGQVVWNDLPADEKFTLTESVAPEGCQVMAPMNITLTAGRTSYVTVPNESEKGFTVKKIDAQNKGVLAGAVFRFEQIDGSYVTTGITGFDGMISFEGDELPYGSYRVTEESAPEGYLKDTRVETVEWTGEKDVLLIFEDVREVQLKIVKVDARSGVSLGGAVFDIYADGKYLTSVTTNDAGEATVTGIKAEMYIEAIEKVAPEHYLLDRTSHGIHIDPYDPKIEDDPVLTITNEARVALRIIKYDRISGKRLPGVTFEIYKDAVLFDTKTTDDNGEINLFDLEPGTYLAVEKSSDDSHIVCTTPQQIELKAGQTATQELVFFNDLKPGMHLIKVDSADLSKPIANAKFKFTAVDGSWGPEELTTGADGTIDLSKLPTGAYVVEELECPGYVIDDFQRIVELKPNETAQFVFTNSKKPSLKLTKTSSDGAPLEGVSFRLAKIEDGSHYLDRTTNERGEILWEGLDPGVYSLVETATNPDHIRDLKEHHVELFPGKESTIVLQNHKRPNLIVYKNDADDGTPIEHTIFTVRAADGHSVDEIETDATGRAMLENLLPGVYEISEKSVPSPYLPDAPSQLVTLYPDRDHTAFFKNHKRPIIEIIKEDSITHDRLPNVRFQVWYASNNTATGEINDLGVYTTDENGRIELDGTKMGTLGLRDGWFRVKELAPPSGYSIKDSDTQEAFIPAGQGHTFRFLNQPLSALCVWKYDSVTGEAVKNAIFQVKFLGGTSGTGGTVIGTYKTSENGSFTVTGLKAGTYIVEELASDSGHVIDSAPQTAYISGEEQDVVQLYFGNSPKGSLLVKKVDDRDGSPLSDVEFFVTTSDGTVVGDANGKFVTDQAGTFLVENIEPGTSLVVKETRQKTGYILDDVPQVAKIKAGQCVTLEFRNKKQGNLIIHKLSSVDKSPLEGAQFKLTYANGQVVDAESGQLSSNGLYWTNSEGQIVVSNVTGTIIATEVSSPEGFVIDANTRSQTVVINPGDDTQELYFYNTPLCSLTLSKKDSVTGKPVANVTFSVKDGNGNLFGRYTTGKDGTVTVTGLVPGSTVVVSEYKVPSTHVLDTTPQTIVLKSGSNTVTSGVVSGGTTTTPGASTGGNGGNNLDFENDPMMTFTLHKYIKGTNYEPLAGVCFKITDGGGTPLGSGDGTFYTNSAGEIVIEGVEPGTTIIAREISTVEGYVLDGESKSVKVKVGEKGPELTFWNEKAGELVIKKLDKLTNQPLVGVEFELTYADGGYVDNANGQLSSNGLYKTDAKGEIRITGITGTVVIKETRCLPGYTMDPGTQTQTVVVRPQETQTITVYNTPGTNLTIQKYVDGTTDPIQGVTFLVTDSSGAVLGPNNGEYTTDRNGRIVITGLTPGTTITAKEIRGASGFVLDSTPQSILIKEGTQGQTLTFFNKREGGLELIKVSASDKTQRIPDTTFEIRRMDGGLVDTITTDSNGRVHLNLDAGDYYAVEIEAGSGFKKDSTPHYFTIRDGKSTTLTVTNEAFSGVIIHKIDSVTEEGIYGVKFLVYDQNKNPIGEYTTDDQGYIYIDDLTVQGKGKLFIRELEAAEGYELDKQYKTVYVQPGKTIEIEWANTPITGQIQVYKYAAEANPVTGDAAGKPLKGAVYEISQARSGKVVDYITTDARGVAASKPLPLGRYKIVEVTAPAYYQLSGKTFDETLEYSGQIIKVSDYDKPANLKVTITKTGNKQLMAGDSMRYDLTVSNSSNVALENFFWHDRFPTDCATAKTITTGTYNARLNYRVTYKTNYNDYRVLAANLLSTNNYTFDLSAIPTMQGEVVTDVRLEFGKVPAGFASVTKPTVVIQTRANLTNGYQVVNRADAGGQHMSQWETGNTAWVTVIVQLRKPTQPNLPKTGY